MPGLAALLSRAFVAFTIECDNAYEARMPQRTTRHTPAAASSGPWLTSMVMWWTCMRFVDEHGISVGELLRLARTATNFDGMRRWGYVVIGPAPKDARAKPPKREWLVRATANGLRARAVWAPLPGEVELRWRERFGAAAIDELRAALRAVIAQFGVALPDCLPILGQGLSNLRKDGKLRAPAARSEPDDLDLPLPLLAKALLAFALQYERRSSLALAVAASVLRVVAHDGTHVADLPRLGGISREAVAMALSVLQKEGYATVGRASPADRLRIVTLSERGRAARHAHQDRLEEVEGSWRERFVAATLERLVNALRTIAGGDVPPAALLEAVQPPPEGWRATQPPIERLPDFPMVLHRGGFPDGA